MSFQLGLDKFEKAFGHFMREVSVSISETFKQEAEARGLTQTDIARELGIDASVVSRRLAGGGNLTLRSVCDLFTAMDRSPLSNFELYHQDIAPISATSVSVNVNVANVNPNVNRCYPFPIRQSAFFGQANLRSAQDSPERIVIKSLESVAARQSSQIFGNRCETVA